MKQKLLLLLFMMLVPLGSFSATTPLDVWNFKVYLDDKPVGFHRFTLSGQTDQRQIHSEARFDVKLLMITAYTYTHEAKESWRGDCLAELDAKTDDNGELTEVKGDREGDKFRMRINKDQAELPHCIMTFAYWHPDMIAQQRLLNPQTGEYLPIRVELKGEESIKAKDIARSAKHYLLDAGKFQIELWYATDDHRWLALDSKLEGGQRLRYRIE